MQGGDPYGPFGGMGGEQGVNFDVIVDGASEGASEAKITSSCLQSSEACGLWLDRWFWVKNE